MPDADLATHAPDTAANPAVSTMVAPDTAPLTEAKQRALEKHFTPAQLEALKGKDSAPEAPVVATPTPKAKAKAKAAPETPAAAAPEADPEVVVDFSTATEDDEDSSTPGDQPATEAEPASLTEEQLAALDATARKSYLDAHKENAKIRKRAQEAERLVADLQTQLADRDTAATRAGDQLPAELNSANSLAHVLDDKTLDAYQRDAKNVLAILQRSANGDDIDTSYRSLVDGKTYEIDHTYAAWAAGTIVDVEGRRKQLTILNKAQEKATKIEARLKDTPGFTDALKAVTGQGLVTEWPQRRVEAAIGTLVTSGQYRLIKISKGTAAGATSPASVTAPTPKKAAPTSPTSPSREPRGTMPSGSPAGDTGVSSARLSQLQQRANQTGHPDDVKALMAAKMELRAASRRNS